MAAVWVISGSSIPEQVQKVRLDSPLAWPGRGFDRDRPSGLMTGQDSAKAQAATYPRMPVAVQAPKAACAKASAATAAVSALRILGPTESRQGFGRATSITLSST